MKAGHGTPARYRYGCRCAPCRYANSHNQYRPLPDPQPVIDHLRLLSEHGIGYRQAARLAGIGRATTLRILSGASRPTARTADRLLAIPLTAPLAEGWVNAIGSVRRIQGLVALGWMIGDIARWADVDATGLARILRGAQPGMQRRTAGGIANVYDKLQWSIPEDSRPARRGRTRAQRLGWFTPQAWDDETIDDPATLPCLLPPVAPVDDELELLVQHLVAGHPVEPTTAAVREVIRRMPDAKPAELASMVRRPARSIAELRSRMKAAAC